MQMITNNLIQHLQNIFVNFKGIFFLVDFQLYKTIFFLKLGLHLSSMFAKLTSKYMCAVCVFLTQCLKKYKVGCLYSSYPFLENFPKLYFSLLCVPSVFVY